MLLAEAKRDAEIAALDDLTLLRRIVTDPKDECLSDNVFAAFVDMLESLRTGTIECLSRKQRAWAEEVCRQLTPIRAADVPRGREVETPAVLRNLPKKPPPRRPEE